MNAATDNLESKVTTDLDGNVFVSVDLPVEIADELIAILRANQTPELSAAIDILAVTLKDAYSVVLEDAFGCPDLLPGGDTDNLTEPAILGSFDGGTLAVLLPGAYSLFDAAVRKRRCRPGLRHRARHRHKRPRAGRDHSPCRVGGAAPL